MKRKVIAAVLAVALLVPTVGFAEPIDLDHMDYFFRKVKDYDGEYKAMMVDMLKGYMGTERSLENLKEDMNLPAFEPFIEKALERGVTLDELKDNIDALKTWSASDRKRLVDLSVSTDTEAAAEEILALNVKYGYEEPSSPASGGAGGGGATTEESTVADETTEVAQEPVRSALAQRLEARGLLSRPYEVVKPDVTFEDTEGHWADETVRFLAERGMISGYTDETFGPKDPIKRQEIVTLLMKVLVTDESMLAPQQGDAWYAPYVRQAQAMGVVGEEVSDLAEAPTREEIIQLMANALEAMDLDLSDDLYRYKGSFSDISETSLEHYRAVALLHNLGIINGNADGTLAPKRTINRAEISVMVKALYDYTLAQLDTE